MNHSAIDTNLINKWLEELESGKYIQTKSQLVGTDLSSFCCLGVLCLIDGMKPEEHENSKLTGFRFGQRFAVGIPSESLLNKVGLTNYFFNPVKDTPFIRARDFSEMNDDGATFEEIAKALRKAYKAKKIL